MDLLISNDSLPNIFASEKGTRAGDHVLGFPSCVLGYAFAALPADPCGWSVDRWLAPQGADSG